MQMLNLNKEWNFIRHEITSSNKGGTIKGEELFNFQILLSVLGRSKNPKERQMLSSYYRERKGRYKLLV